jgi:hypothetical protein
VPCFCIVDAATDPSQENKVVHQNALGNLFANSSGWNRFMTLISRSKTDSKSVCPEQVRSLAGFGPAHLPQSSEGVSKLKNHNNRYRMALKEAPRNNPKVV